MRFKVFIFFIISFIISQILVRLLSKSNYFKSPMYVLLPIVGYFAMYYLTPNILKFMNMKNKNLFCFYFIVVALASFYVALFLFHWNVQLILSHVPIRFNFFKMLGNSAYLEFVISGAIGILAINE